MVKVQACVVLHRMTSCRDLFGITCSNIHADKDAMIVIVCRMSLCVVFHRAEQSWATVVPAVFINCLCLFVALCGTTGYTF